MASSGEILSVSSSPWLTGTFLDQVILRVGWLGSLQKFHTPPPPPPRILSCPSHTLPEPFLMVIGNKVSAILL